MASNEYHNLRIHPAADIFRDQLLSEVEDENRRLREDNVLLESAFNFLSKIEIHLRDGHVISTVIKQSFVMEEDNYLCVPIQSDPQPLLEFGTGSVEMLGQNIGSFPGTSHQVLGIRSNGSILFRFCLSKHAAVEGVLQGLSDEDHNDFKNKLSQGRHIARYLTVGAGLQNSNALRFTPMMILIGVTPNLRNTFHQLLCPVPSNESMKDDIINYINRRPSGFPQLLTLSPSDELRLSVVAALGYEEAQIDLLCTNHLLKNESWRLFHIHHAIESVEISHPSMKTCLSLKGGTLEYDMEGSLVWRIFFSVTVRKTVITRRNISSLAVFLSGIQLTKARRRVTTNGTGDLASFVGEFDNGAQISWTHSEADQIETLFGDIEFPISVVQNALQVLGVKLIDFYLA